MLFRLEKTDEEVRQRPDPALDGHATRCLWIIRVTASYDTPCQILMRMGPRPGFRGLLTGPRHAGDSGFETAFGID